MRKSTLKQLTAVLLLIGASACGDTTTTPPPADLAVSGSKDMAVSTGGGDMATAGGGDMAVAASTDMAGGAKGNYTLALDATYNGAHPGKTVYLKLKDSTGTTTVGGPVSGVIGASGVTLMIPNVLSQGVTYHADYFVDLNGNGTCEAPPTDHSWRIMVTGMTAGVTTNDSHDTTFTDLTPF